jgi:hypothetical protein
MSKMRELINTADLSALVKSQVSIEAVARKPNIDTVDGYLLHFKTDGKELVLSTYLSDKPRLFKRADALIKEATNMGLPSVSFELKSCAK